MRLLIMACTAMLLSACAIALIPKEHAWYATGSKSDTPIDQAIAKCKYDLAINKGMNAVDQAAMYEAWDMQFPFIEMCMATYGYKWEKKR